MKTPLSFRKFFSLFKSRSLNLNRNNIGTGGAIALANALTNKNIRKFHISNNPIQESGAFRLAQAMMTWKDLAFIGFDQTGIGNAGVGFLALALKNADRISYVNLCRNDIRPSGIGYLMDALRKKTDHGTFSFRKSSWRDWL